MEKTKRARRTKKELDAAIWTALEKLIIERGFNDITLIGLAQEAGVEPPVIYNRFDDLDDVFDKYVRRYDYWLKDFVKLKKENTTKENFKKLLTDLINELYENEIMQRILLWELNDTHRVSRRMAQSREVESSDIIRYFEKKMNNFAGIGSVLIAGIYYLVLHRKVSTFSNINFDTQQGKQILLDTVEEMIEYAFVPNNISVSNKQPQTATEIAQNMLEIGVNTRIIELSTGLTAEEINNLSEPRFM